MKDTISSDALVYSNKKDHKYIFLKSNPNIPKDLIPDKKRFKGQMYRLKNRDIYPVIVDMFEHPTIKSGDGDLADIWIVDDLEQAQKQLDLIIKYGAEQFENKIRTGKGDSN
jgi:hypothetical protein